MRSLDSPDRTRVLDTVSMAAYVEPGYLIYQGSGALIAQPFDLRGLRLNGTPARIAESVTVNPNDGLAAFAVSATGALVYRTGEAGSPSSFSGSIALANHSSESANPGCFGDWRCHRTRSVWQCRARS